MLAFDTIAKTESTPQVSFNPNGRVLRICGDSYPENSFTFYAPITKWVRDIFENGQGINLDINVSYMNSSSTKCMLDLLDLMEAAHGKQIEVSVTWRYDRDNPRSLDLAEEFSEEVTLPFHIVEMNQ